jgi:hypothetical protein
MTKHKKPPARQPVQTGPLTLIGPSVGPDIIGKVLRDADGNEWTVGRWPTRT